MYVYIRNAIHGCISIHIVTKDKATAALTFPYSLLIEPIIRQVGKLFHIYVQCIGKYFEFSPRILTHISLPKAKQMKV